MRTSHEREMDEAQYESGYEDGFSDGHGEGVADTLRALAYLFSRVKGGVRFTPAMIGVWMYTLNGGGVRVPEDWVNPWEKELDASHL